MFVNNVCKCVTKQRVHNLKSEFIWVERKH